MAKNFTEPTKTPERYSESAGTGAIPTTFPVYEGFIHSNKDYARTGRVKVRIPALESYQRSEDTKGEEPKESGSSGQGKNFVDVRWMSPFFGYTDYDRATEDGAKTYEGTVKSYGLWATPPDKGAPVIVLFIGGNPNDGIAIGSPVGNQNHAIPGIGANVAYDDGGAALAAVAERSPADKNPDPKIRPEHRFNKILDYQGLAMDGLRGQSTSSAKRETPSRVLGILTPGQHQFVMDDGVLEDNGETTEDANNKTGFPGDLNSLVRLRTANGGQLLIHDTAGIVYLINPKGTAWVEMSDSGKIDVYSRDTISFHTEGDMNLVANKSLNIEGSEINMRATEGSIKIQSEKANIDLTAKQNFNVTADLNGNILIAGHLKEQATRIDMNGPVPERACEPTRYVIPGNKDYKDSIAQRVPEHEPWVYHDEQQIVASVDAPIVEPYTPDPEAVSAQSNTTTPETEPATKIETQEVIVFVDGEPRTVTVAADPSLGAGEEFGAEDTRFTELAEVLKEQKGLNNELSELRAEQHTITQELANTLIQDIVYTPYTTTTNDIPTIGYGTPIESLSTAGTNESMRSIGSSLPELESNAPINSNRKVVGTGGPQKGPIQQALGNAGTKIGNFFSPVGKSIDDVLGFTGSKIASGQRAMDNFWSTAQGAVDNSILRINEAAAKNLPAGTKFGITHNEAYGAWRTRLNHNKNRVNKEYGKTVMPKSVYDGLIASDYYYGDSRRFITPSGRSVDIKEMLQNRQFEAVAEIIKDDPRYRKIALIIHNIMMYGQYEQVSLADKQRQGLRRAAELYNSLSDDQKAQFEIQYYIATGKFPVMMNNKRKAQRIKDIAERSKLIVPGTNVVSYEPVSVAGFATPTQTIITSILTNRKTIGLASYPEGYLFAVAALLSNFDPNKQTVGSGATGLYQFTQTQWNSVVNTYDPGGVNYGLQIVGNTIDQRTDIDKATIAASLITNANNVALFDALLRSPTQDELYAGHLFGIVDATIIAKADTNVSLASLRNLSTGFITNNAVYTQDQLGNTLTVGEFKQNLRNQISKISYQYSLTYGQ